MTNANQTQIRLKENHPHCNDIFKFTYEWERSITGECTICATSVLFQKKRTLHTIRTMARTQTILYLYTCPDTVLSIKSIPSFVPLSFKSFFYKYTIFPPPHFCTLILALQICFLLLLLLFFLTHNI